MPLVVQNWDDLLRLAGSLKLGLVQAGGLIRTLQTNDRPTKLVRALEEWGRVVKSLYLLSYIDDEAYRRRILVQLNRGEGRHQLARAVFHGKRGELRQRLGAGRLVHPVELGDPLRIGGAQIADHLCAIQLVCPGGQCLAVQV